jgi:hypothetical protein
MCVHLPEKMAMFHLVKFYFIRQNITSFIGCQVLKFVWICEKHMMIICIPRDGTY